jgi:hypothetical protein
MLCAAAFVLPNFNRVAEHLLYIFGQTFDACLLKIIVAENRWSFSQCCAHIDMLRCAGEVA